MLYPMKLFDSRLCIRNSTTWIGTVQCTTFVIMLRFFEETSCRIVYGVLVIIHARSAILEAFLKRSMKICLQSVVAVPLDRDDRLSATMPGCSLLFTQPNKCLRSYCSRISQSLYTIDHTLKLSHFKNALRRFTRNLIASIKKTHYLLACFRLINQ